MSSLPFFIHPWHEDFLPRLRDLILEETHGNPGNAILVFPHDRPKRYITRLFSPQNRSETSPRPLILPRMLTVRELFNLLAPPDTNLPREAGFLDRIALLWEATREAGHSASTLGTALATMNEASFFPWGTRLAELLEECLANNLEPRDIQHAEGEVAPFAAALLGSIKEIFVRYRERLFAHNLTTSGLTAFRVCETMDTWETLPPPLAGKTIFLAGFGALNGTEETLLKKLWKEGARICLHGDANLASPEARVHHACTHLARWIRKWKAPCVALDALPPPKREIRFFAGHDLHSQLSALRNDLAQLPASAGGNTAVVLTHTSALLPTLHHLPFKDCNVSLGYPLGQTLLSRLVEAILDLVDSRTSDGRVHWSKLTEIVRQPCLKMLSSTEGSLRGVLLAMERYLREGQRNVFWDSVAKTALFQTGAGTKTEQLLTRVGENTFHAWTRAKTPEDLANCLSGLAQMLLDDGADIWPHFPLDAEGLYRLMHRIIPALKTSVMAQWELPWQLLASILKEMIKKERVPFEADPLTSVQVLGMLETRLLHLKHVFLLDATEDQLPGTDIPNPLLPDSLRGLLGLPDTEHREQLAAYTFYSLIAGAQSVNCYWQEGIVSGGLFDGRKECSRFVEELIWNEERRSGHLLAKGHAPLFVPTPKLQRPDLVHREIPYTRTIREAIDTYLQRPLSPTALNSYLCCPAKFFYEELCGIKAIQTVKEGDDALGVGLLLHSVLHEFYQPWIRRQVRRDELSLKKLTDLFTTRLEHSGLEETLPLESLAMLRVAGPERLRRYLENQPDMTCPLALEKAVETTLEIQGRRLKLGGRIDRIDRRSNGEIWILDYKTGAIRNAEKYSRKTEKTFWTATLFEDIHRALEDPLRLFSPDPEQDLLCRLSETLPSLQLPLYLYMYRKEHGDVHNAAYVELRKDGEEKLLFPSDCSKDLLEKTLDTSIPDLLCLVVTRLLCDSAFRPHKGSSCAFCTAKTFCSKPDLSSTVVPLP